MGEFYNSDSNSFTSRIRARWSFLDKWRFQSYLFYRGARQTTQGRRADLFLQDLPWPKSFPE
ncbi:MAG: hypothetical protein WD604_10225 [Balneolaceae bacterium]